MAGLNVATVLIVTNPVATFHHQARPQTAVQLTHSDTRTDSNEEAASAVRLGPQERTKYVRCNAHTS
jgi:hypothetical protein